jgi:hypothetical protein
MKRKKRYSKSTTTIIQFPQDLIDAFVRCHNENWSEESYIKYSEQARLYLGKKYEDKIEQGTLTVQLTSATYDLVDNNKVNKE